MDGRPLFTRPVVVSFTKVVVTTPSKSTANQLVDVRRAFVGNANDIRNYYYYFGKNANRTGPMYTCVIKGDVNARRTDEINVYAVIYF